MIGNGTGFSERNGMFKGHPKGIIVCFLASMGERFGWYTMMAIFTYYLQERFAWSADEAGQVYSLFMMVIYLMPIVGGFLADRFLGYGKSVAIGTIVMAAGYALMAVPRDEVWFLVLALGVICVGTGLFKGNLAVLVGNLYEKPELTHLRDAAYNIYYMGINVGAFFAPYAAEAMRLLFHDKLGYDLATGYNAAFAASVVGLLFSLVVFVLARRHYAHADYRASDKKHAPATQVELSPKEVRDRIVALLLVFLIVVVFWMIFQQNGLVLSLFARDYTNLSVGPITHLFFDLWGLLGIIALVLGAFFALRKGPAQMRALSAVVSAGGLALVLFRALSFQESEAISPELFQAFNPLFIVFFTPLILGFFAFMNKKGKEPSAPGKIAWGLVITALAGGIMAVASLHLPSVAATQGARSSVLVSPYWLVSTYFTFTVAELFLSPMGMSFVAKVCPPKLRGLMQGGWMASIAIGNKLTSVVSTLYVKWELWQTFLFLVGLAALAALAMALMLKKLKRATAA